MVLKLQTNKGKDSTISHRQQCIKQAMIECMHSSIKINNSKTEMINLFLKKKIQ